MALQTKSTPHTDDGQHDAGAGRGVGGAVLVGLLALACPLLCGAPFLLVALTSAGLAHALHGAPWPLIAGAVLVITTLGVWGTRARQARGACCAPTSGHAVPGVRPGAEHTRP